MALVLILVAYLAGVLVALAALPRLADTANGRLSFLVAANIVGAAVAVVADEVWIGIRTATTASVGQLPAPISVTESVITSTAKEIALYGGALLAMAIIVYLLGPADNRRN